MNHYGVLRPQLLVRSCVAVLLIVCIVFEPVVAGSAGNDDRHCTMDVSLSLGVVRGSKMRTRLNKEFLAFRGMRYAQSPVGELRFRNPEPVKAWKPEIFDATVDGPMCPQVVALQNVTDLSEDCLRLNVYTKDMTAKKPVVVYLHPGGFYFMSGQSKNFAGPEHLMERDIVLVTLNYRLASLGFLATGTSDAPGNAGLKDQVIALRWVRDHISSFGGDPKSVTLLGYSAGSLSIGLHMLSPMSKDLFHRAIAMSASPLGQWQYFDSDILLAERQARLVDCSVASIEKMLKCLRLKPMMAFVDTIPAMFEANWNPVLNWQPVIEPDCGQERFLVENPYKTIQSGNFNKVPLITGITEFEFLGAAYYGLINDTARRAFNEEFEKYAPILFLYGRNQGPLTNITAALRSHYLGDAQLSYPDSLIPFGELYSDGVIGFEYHRFLQLVARHVPVYTYLFTYTGRYSYFMPPPRNESFGAVHHDELLYLLHVSTQTPLFRRTDPEHETIERLTRMWTEFAQKGDPHNADDEYLRGLKWPLYDPKEQQYLEIGNELIVHKGGIHTERFQLWDKLFPIPQFKDENPLSTNKVT